MKILCLLLLTSATCAFAQTEEPLPDKLKKLREGYLTAVAKATAPLTSTYVRELEKLREDYTKAGDLKAALAAERLLQDTEDISGKSLAEMTDRQFKRWLSTVVIAEVGSPYGNSYRYDDGTLVSAKEGSTSLRTHPTASVTVGRLVVPFTSTVATIVINPTMTKATVTFSTGGTYEATIAKK